MEEGGIKVRKKGEFKKQRLKTDGQTGGGGDLHYGGRRCVQRTVKDGRRDGGDDIHLRENKRVAKKQIRYKYKLHPLFLRRMKASGGEGEGPLDAQAGKRLMKEHIDRCVDRRGLSELSRCRSDGGLQKE